MRKLIGLHVTLHVELSPEQEARLTSAARQAGVAPSEFAQRLLAERLPELPVSSEAGAHRDLPDAEWLAQVRRIRGKYAGVGVTSADLQQERQADRQRDER